MNSSLFDECVKELDKKFEKENRKVILIVDKNPGSLKTVELVFLLPKTTLKTQPMDQVVMRSIKKKNRKKMMQRLIRAVDMKKKRFPKHQFQMQCNY